MSSSGTYILFTGSDLLLQRGSIIPFALPASYVMFSGSIAGTTGPYYAINGSTNMIEFSGTSASTVLQTAINKLSGSSGGTINIRTGSYVINTPITPGNTITLRGEGGNIFQNNSYIGTNLILGNNVNDWMFRQSNDYVEGFRVYNIVFDGNADNQTNGGIFNAKAKRCVFEHCYITNSKTTAIQFSGSDSSDFGFHNKVINCRITKSTGTGIKSRFSDENWYVDNHFSFLDGFGIESLSGLDKIDGNTFINVGTGSANTMFPPGSMYALRCANIRTTVVNNRFDMTGPPAGGGGLLMHSNALACIVSNNQFNNTDGSGIVFNGADDCVCTNNVVYKCNRTSGSGGSGSAIWLQDIKFAIVANNKLLDDMAFVPTQKMVSGVWEDSPARLNSLLGNSISGSTGAAIRFNPLLQAPINQSGSSIAKDNRGYNPVGYINDGDIQMNSSPFTYTNNDYVIEEVYLYSGSIQSITGSGGFPYMTSGPIRMEPNQSIVIKAAATPIIIKRLGY